MKKLLAVLLLAGLPAGLAAQSPLKVGDLTFTPPTVIAKIDLGKLKGLAARLAWSPDATQLYLQTMEGNYGQPTAIHHYLIDAATGKIADAQGPPEWFMPYWTAKSHKFSPDVPGLAIDVAQDLKRQQTTAVPRGGDLARGGTDTGATGTTLDDATKAAYGSQMVSTITMKLKGEIIGEFVNSVSVPGLTFAWAPKGFQVIAYTDVKKGKIFVMDQEGKKQEVNGSKDAILPAWSHDASQLAWLEKDGKKKYELKITNVR